MTKCECGHESCYHIIDKKKGLEFNLFNKNVNPLQKKCSIQGCQCLRYTPPPADY